MQSILFLAVLDDAVCPEQGYMAQCCCIVCDSLGGVGTFKELECGCIVPFMASGDWIVCYF